MVQAIRNGLIKRLPYVRRYQDRIVELANRQHIEPDLIVFATGFTYSLEHLEGLLDLDPEGRPIIRNCESTRTRGLFLMGYRYGRTFASPYLRGIARDAEYVAEEIARRKRAK